MSVANSALQTPPLLFLLAVAGFSSVASTRLCDAMLPALARSFATSPAQASAAISSYAVAYGLMQWVYGPLGDRFGKPRVILLALAWCALGTAAAALAKSLDALVLARAAMGAGAAAVVPLSVAWIGDTVPLAQRQQVLARYSSFTVCGMVLGPLLGGLMAEFLSWRGAFMVLAPLLAAICLALLLRPRTATGHATGPEATAVRGPACSPPPGAAPQTRRPAYRQQLKALLSDRWSLAVMAASFLEAVLAIGSLAFVPTVLHAQLGLSLLAGGAITALFGAGGFAFSRSAARMLRCLRAPDMPRVAGLILALAYALLALMPHWSFAVLGCLLAGFGFFTLHNTLQVQATQLSADATGLAVSLFSACNFTGQSLGVALGATLLARVGHGWIFSFASLGLLLLGLGLSRGLHARLAAPSSQRVA